MVIGFLCVLGDGPRALDGGQVRTVTFYELGKDVEY